MFYIEIMRPAYPDWSRTAWAGKDISKRVLIQRCQTIFGTKKNKLYRYRGVRLLENNNVVWFKERNLDEVNTGKIRKTMKPYEKPLIPRKKKSAEGK